MNLFIYYVQRNFFLQAGKGKIVNEPSLEANIDITGELNLIQIEIWLFENYIQRQFPTLNNCSPYQMSCTLILVHVCLVVTHRSQFSIGQSKKIFIVMHVLILKNDWFNLKVVHLTYCKEHFFFTIQKLIITYLFIYPNSAKDIVS